jgi:hypothetical protein
MKYLLLSSQPSVECSPEPRLRWILLQFLKNSPNHQPQEFPQECFCPMTAAEEGVGHGELAAEVVLGAELVMMLVVVVVVVLVLMLHHL